MDFLDYVQFREEETGNPAMPVMMEEEKGNDVEPRMNTMKGRGCRGQVYKVKKGDTLYSISRRYDLRVRDLMMANPFVNVYNLQVGDELCIPVAPGNEGRPELTPYVVKRGDTILSILKRYRVTYEDLAAVNRSVEVLSLPPGTVLLIP